MILQIFDELFESVVRVPYSATYLKKRREIGCQVSSLAYTTLLLVDLTFFSIILYVGYLFFFQ